MIARVRICGVRIVWGLILSIFFFASTQKAHAADQTLSGASSSGNLRITARDDGGILLERHNGTNFVNEVFVNSGIPSKGSRLFFDGSAYSFGYYLNGATQVTSVSNSTSGNKIMTEFDAGPVHVVQIISYLSGDKYYSIEWLLSNLSPNPVTDLRFFHGEDTFLSGGDAGAGFFDVANTSVGVEKIVSSNLERLVLQGIAVPFSFESQNFAAVQTHVETDALVGVADPNSGTDNGYALEWRQPILPPNGSWRIAATEKILTASVGGSVVLAPTLVEPLSGVQQAIAFTVTNISGSNGTANLSLATDQSPWSPVIISPGASLPLNAGQSSQVVVQFTVSPGTPNGTKGFITLNSDLFAVTSSDTANIITQTGIPEVTTDATSNVTSTTAISGGEVVTDFGFTVASRGVCYGTSPAPTITGTCASSSAGVGRFTELLTGLTPNTTYYVRAFGTNFNGTGYGNEETFTTTSGFQPTATPTATSTPTATPTATSTPLPLFQVVSPGASIGKLSTVRGVGLPSSSISVAVDGQTIGTATVPNTGLWTVSNTSTTELALGGHVLAAQSSDPFGRVLDVQQPLIITGGGSLDFNGDGLTELATYSVLGTTVSFRIRNSATDETTTINVLGKVPAVEDYDGDGAWDLGTIRRSGRDFVWLIRGASSVSPPTEVKHGSLGDTLITGCRLLSKEKGSLVAISGGTVQAKEISTSVAPLAALQLPAGSTVLGCMDVSGDGVDEIIISQLRNEDEATLSALAMDGTVVQTMRVGKFSRGFVVRKPGNPGGYVNLVRVKTAKSRTGTLVAFDDETNPTFGLPRKLIVSSGTFLNTGLQPVLAVRFEELTKGKLGQFDIPIVDIEPAALGRIPKIFKLLMPQTIYETR